MGAAPSDELEHIWSLVRSQLALVVEEPTFRLWLEPLRAVEITDEQSSWRRRRTPAAGSRTASGG